MVANNQSILYDIETGTETRLPDIPNGVRVTNPFDGSATLLPLSPPFYTPEVLVCGGTNSTDQLPVEELDSQFPASDQCSRIELTPEGIKRGWTVEHMLEGRMMPELLLLPNGQVLIVNGAQTGFAAFAGVKNAVGGQSNADNPAWVWSLTLNLKRLIICLASPLHSTRQTRQLGVASVTKVYQRARYPGCITPLLR